MKHLLTPINGWRVFAGEVGVIVLGVLIALGAQKILQDVQTRNEVRTFRETIDTEIAYNLWIYAYRDLQHACVQRRVDQLAQWLEVAEDGGIVALIDARYPPVFSLYRSAWDNRNAQVFAALPRDARQKYAEFYDELANNVANFTRERDKWDQLVPYEQAGPLSLDDRRLLYGMTRVVRRLNNVHHGNIDVSVEIARKLGIAARRPDGILPEELQAARACPRVADAV